MPSAWLEKYQQGSFRSVFFFTESHEFTGGRRTVAHEFPQRERSRTEDLGRKIRRFSVELYVLEDRIGHDSGSVISVESDYFVQRDELIEALEQEGPGDLVHPYLGNVRVQVDSFTISESKDDGRIARFSVSFVEAGELVFPQLSESNLDDVTAKADAANDSSKNVFEQALDVVGFASFVADQAAADLEAQVDFFDAQVSKVTGPITEMTVAFDNLRDQKDALVQTPGRLANQIESTFELLFDVVVGGNIITDIVAAFVGSDAVAGVIVGETPSKLQSKSNQSAMVNVFKRIAHATEAKSISDTDFNSVNDALSARESLVGSINLQLEEEGIDDDLYQNLRDLQASLIRAVPSRNTGTVRTITTGKTLPSLVLAHQVFVDLDREEEIIQQNLVENPSFVPSGSGIEVTSA